MTNNFKEQLTPPSTAEVFLFLLDIHPPTGSTEWTTPFHIVNDIVGHTVNGVVYEPYAFKFTAPSTGSGAEASLELDDIDRRFTAALRTVLSPPTVKISLVSDRDMTVSEEDETWEFKLTSLSITGTTVTADLKKDTILDNTLTGHYISSENFPGFFS